MGDSSEPRQQADTKQGQDTAEAPAGDSLADAARDARQVAGERLREELGREPTDEEANDWLRRHTEGY